MTRRTRSQLKAKQMAADAAAAATNRPHNSDTTNSTSNHTKEATMTSIVSGEKNVSEPISKDGRMTSAIDADNGEEKDCPVCDRPNNAERFRVQCKKCVKWYHFTCAEISNDTAVTDMFTCITCLSRDSAPPPSSITGRSSTSSARRARLARELELLEEERKMQEEAQQEQLERERLMNERAAKEKIERDRQYLAKKRDLLIQHEEEDEIASLRSYRSTRITANRVEDWVVEQVNEASHIGPGVVEETSKPVDPTHHTVVHSGEAPVKQRTSTPIQNERLEPFPPRHDPARFNDINLTTGSITIGENELEGAVGGGPISLVDLQPLQKILEEPKPVVSRTGTVPKLARRSVVPYDQWQSETINRRKMNELEIRHQQDLEIRRKRELELVEQIKRLHVQKDADMEQLRRQEADTRKQLKEIADRQTAMEVQRLEELKSRDAELGRLRATEQQLKHQLDSMRQQQQQQAPRPKPDLHAPTRQHQEQPNHPVFQQPGESSRTRKFDVDSYPVSLAPPIPKTINKDPQPIHHMHDYHPLIPSTPIGGRSTYSVPITPTIIPPPMPSYGGDYFPDPPNPAIAGSNGQQGELRPTQQQLAARQVLSKELPVFSGDPVDWPLFISSYKHSSEACGYSDSENLLRLQRALKGAARDAVSSFLLHPSTVQQVMSTLQILFGRPEQIVHTMVMKIRATPPPKSEKLETLVNFGLIVQNLCGHLKAVGLDWHLSNPTLLQELVDKLPANVKFNWAMYQQQFSVVDLNVFSEYMARVVSATSSVTVSSIQHKNSKDDHTRAKEKAYVNAHTTTEQDELTLVTEEDENLERKGRFVHVSAKKAEQVMKCPVCNAQCHQAGECSKFKGLSLDNRWSIVKEHKLCRRCLKAHLRWPCKGDPCGVNGCQKLHHRLLHYEPSTDSQTTEQTTNATVTIHQNLAPLTLFRVLPVTLYGKHGELNTLAFLDDGSSVTLVDRTVADTLGLDGQTEPLCIQWTSGINKTISDARIVQMEISAQGSTKRFKLEGAFTVNGLGLPEQSLNFEEMTDQYKHLRKLPVQSFKSATPGILIGLNNSHLLATLKLREGHVQEPIASKTRIGWAVYGSIRGGDQLQHRQMHICAKTAAAGLHEYVREFFSLENLGIALAPNLEGAEEGRARQILEETTRRTECGKFETGLLWKHDYIELPDSRPMAEKRLKCLEKRLQRHPELYETVRKQIAEFQFKGYVHEATEEEMKNFDLRRTWYLPLGIVMNPNKPGKVRLIWDAAAKVEGISLNDQLLKGPDLLTSLLAVLFQFREREVAISADIMEMFLQILIRLVDRSALLFLWRDFPDRPIKVMVTDVAIFGATCSPVQSQFVKNLNAAEHEKLFPRAASAITNKHYVDDYLDSVDTIEEAVQIATDVSAVHGKADFFIRNWMSNRPEVLERIGQANPAAVKRFAVGKECKLERLLGMIWSPDDDVFSFDLCLREELQQVIDGGVVPSKRELLSVVMSLYDPLGLVSAFVIHGKVLVQDTWRVNIGWDEKIPSEILCRWNQWLKVLREMTKVKISRCYFPGYDPVSYNSLQLHIFVDASEQAFAAVAYFRIVDRGEVRCALVSSKTKVAPLQALSMPRLELMAALIGARLRKSIEDHHSVKISRTFFWSDSTTVIAWIKSDSRRYRQFVAFRVNEILSLSTIDEWKWIGTRTNVADEATKWGKGPSTDTESRWYRGPAFLYDRAGLWLEESVEETNEELRPAVVCPHFLVKPLVEFERFSKFERLKRCLAYVHRFIDNLRRVSKGDTRETARQLSRVEMQKSELTMWKLVQSEAYPDEVTTMKRNMEPGSTEKLLERSSRIAKLPPMLDEDGFLRVDSRIGAAEYLPFDTRYPIILPRRHHVTDLLLDWYHREHRHANDETVVNEVRQRFYISQLRTRVRMTKTRCMWCRVYKSVPVIPKMGPLPTVRLTPYVRAFTFVGIDYFGPYLVKVGRSVAKRWGVVFTCLTIRAIHIEVASSLTADSCKKAMRRFIARRGAPQEIYSDNGTNFLGVSRELAKETEDINSELSSTFTDTYTQWRFNPPSAPHMGGCWERMVRSIKSALGAIPSERKLDDESLVTLFAEAEKMINSRPLTFVSLETSYQEAITPNHFLLLSSTGVRQPVKEPVSEGESLRSSWNMLQYTLDNFWRRWIIEYLPTITRRTKWFQNVRPIREGELVVIADEKVRNRWLRGRVVRTYPGKDGTVRQADVMTSGGILRRPVVKLALLDVEPEDDAKAEGEAS